MQEEKNLLDQYLKQKVEEAHFSFKEEYWQKAAQMLDEEDKKNRRPFFWRGFTILAVIIFVGIGSFLFSKMDGHKNDTQANTKADLKLNENKLDRSYTVDQEKQEQNEEIKINPATETKKPEKNKPVATPLSTLDKPATEAKTNSVPENNQTLAGNSPEKEAAGQNENKQKRTKRGTKNDKQKNENGDSPKKDQQTKKHTLAANANADQLPGAVMVNGRKMQAVDSVVTLIKRDESIYNPRYNASLRNYITERADTQILLSYMPAPEVVATAPAPEIVKDTVEKKKNETHFFVAAGGNFNKGFQGNMNTSVSWGITPYLNAGIEKQIHRRISIASQIGFTYFNALNLEKKVHTYKYSFGYDSTSFKVTYQKLLQINIPVSIYYQLNKLHSLFGAAGISYIFNTASKVKESNNSTAKTSFGYTEGFNPLDVLLQLGYQLQINKKTAIQAFFQQGLLDATKNNYFLNNIRNAQTRVSIGFKYNFGRNTH